MAAAVPDLGREAPRRGGPFSLFDAYGQWAWTLKKSSFGTPSASKTVWPV
jgi:hypothetical protein